MLGISSYMRMPMNGKVAWRWGISLRGVDGDLLFIKASLAIGCFDWRDQ